MFNAWAKPVDKALQIYFVDVEGGQSTLSVTPKGESLLKSPGLEDLWQLHFLKESAAAHNVAAEFIANPDGPDVGNYLELSARPDGSFDVLNSRTLKTKHYPAR